MIVICECCEEEIDTDRETAREAGGYEIVCEECFWEMYETGPWGEEDPDSEY